VRQQQGVRGVCAVSCVLRCVRLACACSRALRSLLRHAHAHTHTHAHAHMHTRNTRNTRNSRNSRNTARTQARARRGRCARPGRTAGGAGLPCGPVLRPRHPRSADHAVQLGRCVRVCVVWLCVCARPVLSRGLLPG
jgi:hypothetical protein